MNTPLIDELLITAQWLDQGQIEAAHTALKRLHKAHPKNTQVLLQYAFAERLRKRWPEAIALMRKATSLAPNDLLLTEHLCNMLIYSNIGKHLAEAVGHYATILKQKPFYTAVATNLIAFALRSDMPGPVLKAITPLLTQPDLDEGTHLHYSAACAVASYLLGDFSAARLYSSSALAHPQAGTAHDTAPGANDRYFMRLYAELVHDLLAYHTAHPAYYTAEGSAPKLHIIGESHCLAPAHLAITTSDGTRRVVPHLIMGAKAYFLSLDRATSWADALNQIIHGIRRDEPLVVCFGEIDCRAREGIMEQYRRTEHYAIAQEIETLCTGYVRNVKHAQLKRGAPTFLLGVPAPNRVALDDLQAGEEAIFTQMIAQFNQSLARAAATQQLGFLDIYAATLGSDGWAKEGVHLDHVHLKPEIVAELLAQISVRPA